MSDNKKYYYIRLKENFFDTNEIVLLESMQDGHLYSNILLKLYLRSLKDNGKLMFNDRIPYNPQMIATITRHQVGTVEKALSIFKEMGLIEVLDNGAIYMLDIQNFIGKTTTEADRKRAYRYEIENQKELIGQMSDKNPPKINIDKELDIELDKNINKKYKLVEEFEELWSLYPKKQGKKKALDKYIKCRKKNEVTYEIVKQGIINYNRHIEKNKVSSKYIKQGSTWFNQECWNDQYDIEPQRQLIPRNFEEEFAEIVDDIDF